MTRSTLLLALTVAGLMSLNARAQTAQTRLVPADQRPSLSPATGGSLLQAGQTGTIRPGATLNGQAPRDLYYNGVHYRAVGKDAYRMPVQRASWIPGRARLFSAGYAAPAATAVVPGVRAGTPAAMPSGYYYGRGLIGQPKLYVPRQPLRNFFRYITP